MQHDWKKYFDTESEYWEKIQKIYKENDNFPKVIVSGRNLHHKFMRSFSKLEGTEIDNDKENLVSLSLPDHLRVHYYLYKCTKTGFRNRTGAPVRFMLKKALHYVTDDTIELIMHDWQTFCGHDKPSLDTRQKMSKAHKGKALSEEHKKHISESKEGDKNPTKNPEVRKRISESMKGKKQNYKHTGACIKGMKFFNNGIENKRAFECPKGYKPGRLTKYNRSK